MYILSKVRKGKSFQNLTRVGHSKKGLELLIARELVQIYSSIFLKQYRILKRV